MDCDDLARCRKATPEKFTACVEDDCHHCADCFKTTQTPEAVSTGLALLNARRIKIARPLATVVLNRLRKNKTTPEWLKGSIENIQLVLAGAYDNADSI